VRSGGRKKDLQIEQPAVVANLYGYFDF